MDPRQPYQHQDYNDVLQIGPRHKDAHTDELVAQIFHRTTGGGRSALIERPEAERLYAWLGEWLAQGWDGTERRCGRRHETDDHKYGWQCSRPPGHRSNHAGRPAHWQADQPKPGLLEWPRTPHEIMNNPYEPSVPLDIDITPADPGPAWEWPAGDVQRDTDGTITRGPSKPCGCPLDSGCTGRHPGALT